MSKPTNLRTKRKKSASNGFKIDCAYDALVDPETLIPNPRNPNKHPQRQLDLLAKIIKHQGFRRPIVVSNRSGFIIVGHARLEAARIAGFKQVPVDYQDYANEAAEWADMIADNRLAELAEMSVPDLKDLLGELDTGAFDMDLTGFDQEELENLMTRVFNDIPMGDLPNYDGKIALLFERETFLNHRAEIERALADWRFTVKGAS